MASLVACTTTPSQPRGNQALGIAAFETTMQPDGYRIVGVDADGLPVASLRLRIGHVEIPMAEVAGAGRELTVAHGDVVTTHASVGFTPLTLPEPPSAELVQFLHDVHVAPMLAQSGISIVVGVETDAAPVEPSEQGYGHGVSCPTFPPSCSGVGADECCSTHPAYSGAEFTQFVICNPNGSNPQNRAVRQCKAPNQVTSCGLAGPAGCSVCWTQSFTSPKDFHVEFDDGGLNRCRWVYAGTCFDNGAACEADDWCCDGNNTLQCDGGTCCTRDRLSCSDASECCNGTCTDGQCCSPITGPCVTSDDCCAEDHRCTDGFCDYAE